MSSMTGWCGSRFAQALASLPLQEREELLEEAEAVLAASGAVQAEYGQVVEAWLAGDWPPPEQVRADLSADLSGDSGSSDLSGGSGDSSLSGASGDFDLSGGFGGPGGFGDSGGSGLSGAMGGVGDSGGGVGSVLSSGFGVAGLAGVVGVDGRGVARVSPGVGDEAVLWWIRRATAVEQQAQWLRSVGVSTLVARWARRDAEEVEAFVREQSDPGRRRRMRAACRRSPVKSHVGVGGVDGDGNHDVVDPRDLAEAFVAAETALVCGTSERVAREWLRVGSALVDDRDGHRFPLLGEALAAGRVDWAKVRIVVQAVQDRDPVVAAQVETVIVSEIVLPDPVTGEGSQPVIRTVPALRERLRTLLLLLDPEPVVEDVDREREDRRVYTRLVTAYTGELIAVLPLEQIAVIAARLDAAAEAAHKHHDPRTADQVRADTLTLLLTGHDPAPPITPPAEHAEQSDCTEHAEQSECTEHAEQSECTEPAGQTKQTKQAGQAGQAGSPEPPGQTDPTDQAEPAEQAEQAERAEPAGQTDSAEQIGGVGRTEPSERAEWVGPAEQAEPVDPVGVVGSGRLPVPGAGGPVAGAGRCACGRPVPVPPAGTVAHLTVVMTLETMLGLANDPAYLDHHGPVPADLARGLLHDLATDLAATGTFRCAAVDDTHATVLGLGRPTRTSSYRPGHRLQDLIRTTWRRCSFPGCRTRALRPGHGELDHTTPWPTGTTCSCNLSPLCKRHHQMKTHGRITLQPSTNPTDPPGTLRWRLPSGHTYTSHPHPMIIDRSALHPTTTPATPTTPINTPTGDDPPPF